MNPARIYIACPMRRVERARAVAGVLEREEMTWADGGRLCKGPRFAIASRWHEPGVLLDDDLPDDILETLAEQNEADLLSADAIVALTEDEKGLAVGRETYAELGLAYAHGKPVVWSLERAGGCLSRVRSNVQTVRTDAQIASVLAAVVKKGVRRPLRQLHLVHAAAE